ncbi:E2/UBC family protein [Methylocella silvestris]|uniref:E2 family protein E n=1 Tax=Methylocella silvestris TaxID=199596 RepID=A0A2J7TCA7_METSI|nr:E2/UBC family protein [Methylocella silvestris]PNG24401.1 hypothetical protein CR492_18770 [Methylocella silvestris]
MNTQRRQFDLLPDDQKFLDELGLPWETIVDGSPWVLIHDFPTHDGYTHATVTAAIRIETGYPAAALDMVYLYPALARKDRQTIGATQAMQALDGRQFQRWSRHRTGANPWKANFDNIGTHICLVEDWLAREFEK